MESFQEVVSRNTIKTNMSIEAGLTLLVDSKKPVNAIFDGIVNLNELSIDERLGLLRGPKVSVVLNGNVVLDNVPVRAFMATSHKANLYFRKNPHHKKIELPTSCASEEALTHLLKYTITDDAIGCAGILRVPGGVTFRDNVELYKAGVALGMGAQVQHVAKYLRTSISTDLVSCKDLTVIVASLPVIDPIFTHLANDLARRRFQKRIPDEVEFETYLKLHPNLMNAMAAIDVHHEASRQRAKKAHEVHKKAIARSQEKQDQIERHKLEKQARRSYNARVIALTKKVNDAKGGLVSLTYEEGQLCRELGI